MSEQRLAECDLGRTLGRSVYKTRLERLQGKLRRIELAYKFAEARAVIVIEGWDAVGKGGVIRRLTSVLDPRGYKVWPIAAPSDAERAEHYLQRFWRKLPPKGTWSLFDRSWYGRVLVERVEGLAAPAAWRRAYGEINAFERMLADDGVRIVKLFLHVSEDEQRRRLRDRMSDPLERWKMSCDDLRNLARRDAYIAAIDDMLRLTDTRQAPWHVVPFENKRYGRVSAIERIVERLAAGMDLAPPPLDAQVLAAAGDLLPPKLRGLAARAKSRRKRSASGDVAG